ncbi:hypothetical protein ACTFIZ_007842 [Dictyostelium cf. discoideum]
MKTLLFSLLFLIFLISFTNAVKVNQNQYVESQMYNCDATGFTADYTYNSINVAVSFNSYVVPFTYSERGLLMQDYENKIAYFKYTDIIDGVTVSGHCYDFFNNKTQYVYVNQTGSEECYITDLQINMFEKVNTLEKIDSVKIGSMECDVYQNNIAALNFTNQKTIVDSSDCSIISIILENDAFFPGNAVWSLFNYQPKPINVQVPSICFEKPSSMKNFPKNLQFPRRFF